MMEPHGQKTKMEIGVTKNQVQTIGNHGMTETKQGKTGWYIDSSGELTPLPVSEDGEWTRIS